MTTELLCLLLRLDESMSILGARVCGDVVELRVNTPDAPQGAIEALPHYYRATDAPDPVFLKAIEWLFADGSSAIQQVPHAEEGTR
ncbi:MAG: hypothetical protein ACREQ5_00580 [Candidatus Dormibacteria bacterium]